MQAIEKADNCVGPCNAPELGHMCEALLQLLLVVPLALLAGEQLHSTSTSHQIITQREKSSGEEQRAQRKKCHVCYRFDSLTGLGLP